MTPQETLDESRRGLFDIAILFASGDLGDNINQRALCEAAQMYAKAFWTVRAPPKPERQQSAVVIPFGRSKGKSISECDAKDLQWVLGAVEKSIDDPAKERFRAKNSELAEAIRGELEGR